MKRWTGVQLAAPAFRDHINDGNIGSVTLTPADSMNRRLEKRPIAIQVSWGMLSLMAKVAMQRHTRSFGAWLACLARGVRGVMFLTLENALLGFGDLPLETSLELVVNTVE